MLRSVYERVPSQTPLSDRDPDQIELPERGVSSSSDPAEESLQSSNANSRENKAVIPASSRFERRFSGWRFGVALNAILMTSVLLTNIIFTIWATATYGTKGGIGTIRTGNCGRIENASTWLHLAINVLGTAMLSGSNYCMQRLSAPTRQELNKAHASKVWLDIGIMSLRNFRTISKRRLAVWLLLAMSSVPLHLLYNSAIFTQIAVYDYNVLVVTEDFLTGAAFDNTFEIPYSRDFAPKEEIDWLQDHSAELDRLDNAECINAYSTKLPTTRSDVLVVSTKAQPSNGSLIDFFSFNPEQTDPASWLCNDDPSGNCPASKALSADPWVVKNTEVAYCLSLSLEEQCELQFSLAILLVVVACNLIKAIGTLMTVWKMNHPTLVTLGDAISSFLQFPDETTREMCLASKEAVQVGTWKFPPQPRKWTARRQFWFAAASPFRWVTSNILCICGIAVPAALLTRGLRSIAESDDIDISLRGLRALGFGQVSTSTLVETGSQLSLTGNVLLANLPQFILSLLYLSYNAIYTCELVAHEWNRFGYLRKRLRVTSASPGQVSTYYLGLPYSYGVPLLIISVLLHWLFSRSIFLVNIKFLDYRGLDRLTASASSSILHSRDITQCGYSPIAIIISIIISGVMVIVGLVNGFRRYRPGIPLAGTCSAAISAACHPHPDEIPDAAFMPVQWGVVSHADGIGHCSLSSRHVDFPNTEDFYLGEI
ncbi:MAG: hypothetical protein M1825_002044 [Sarcosagium campestre]|nr:MAG: hypothetical protein M1825_002044 [Sarcosagium campestre]